MGTCSSKGRRIDTAVLRIPTPPPRQPFPSTSKNEKSNAFNFNESFNSRRGSIESSEEATATTPIPSKSRDVESETETTTNHPSSILRPQTFSFKKIHETSGSSMKSTTQEEGTATKEWSIRNKSITWADIEGESDSISCIIVLSAATTSDDDIRASLSRMKKQEEQGEEYYCWSDLDDDGKEDDDTTTLPESKSEDDSICSSDSSSGDGYDSFRRSTSSTSQIRFSLVYDD